MMNNPENKERNYFEDQQLCRSWLKILESLRQETALLMNRLAESLQHAEDPAFVEQAEIFQTQMLQMVDAVALLRHEVMEQLDWLDIIPQPQPVAPHQFAALDRDVQKMEKDFNKMKTSFFSFINGG
ncbi:MAG TPA: hypothetical protein VM802_04400 [Chitinophaga sp.]|uniref:hypothetical protein n=1 Tax=Chitinophaga sp. TaxID=1869181 RepID=UPI002BF2CE4C|nr:hypothetical protein [Chitinophaga sp.]HVI44079.1 hypothetical protein [Chitinophaga sp.]